MESVRNAIEAIKVAIDQLEVKRLEDTITEIETETYNVLRASYEILARTSIVGSMVDNQNKPLFKHSNSDTLWEYIYRLVSSMGPISFRNLLNSLLRERQLGSKALNHSKICEALDLSRGTVGYYISKKRGMPSDTLERIINYILFTNN